MTAFVPPDLITHSVWQEARSALPDAPVVRDGTAPGSRHPRARLGRLLRTLARRQLGLAERLDPSPSTGCRGRPARLG